VIPRRHRVTKKELSGKGQLSGEDERLLIQRVKAGDQKAFEAIFNHYVSRVYRQAFKIHRLRGFKAESGLLF